MPAEDAITVEGTVLEVLKPNLWRVELPNRHRILAYASGQLRMNLPHLIPGDKVTVVMSPFDFSKGAMVQF